MAPKIEICEVGERMNQSSWKTSKILGVVVEGDGIMVCRRAGRYRKGPQS